MASGSPTWRLILRQRPRRGVATELPVRPRRAGPASRLWGATLWERYDGRTKPQPIPRGVLRILSAAVSGSIRTLVLYPGDERATDDLQALGDGGGGAGAAGTVPAGPTSRPTAWPPCGTPAGRAASSWSPATTKPPIWPAPSARR